MHGYNPNLNSVALQPGIYAHASGALWIPDSATAVVADVHLGYSWAQRRRGELGPIADERVRDKLRRLFDELHPARVVFLGDLVHAPRPCDPERAWIEAVLSELAARAELISVRGNHDRRFSIDFAGVPVTTAELWRDDHIIGVHGDRLPPPIDADSVLILGHLHPAFPVLDAAGAGQKLPIFLTSKSCIVLPAFSPFAGGFDVLAGFPDELLRCLGNGEVLAFATTGARVVPLGPLDQAIARMFASQRGSAERFRRGA